MKLASLASDKWMHVWNGGQKDIAARQREVVLHVALDAERVRERGGATDAVGPCKESRQNLVVLGVQRQQGQQSDQQQKAFSPIHGRNFVFPTRRKGGYHVQKYKKCLKVFSFLRAF